MRLIVNADDFGLTPGINRAIVELHQAGVVTSATLMAAAPAAEEAMALALAHRTLGVGCHVVLVDGTPVSPPGSIRSLLGGDGRSFRRTLLEFAAAVLRGAIRPEELAREARAQVGTLQRAGLAVTHLDTHKHTHCFPVVAECLMRVAEGCGVRALRRPFEPAWSVALARASALRRLQVRALGSFAEAFGRVTGGGLMPDLTLGIAATGGLDAGVLRATLLAAMARDPEGTYELCCHPGYDDAALGAVRTRLRGSREVERRALLEVVPEMLSGAEGLRLIHFGDLEGGSG